MDCSIYKDDKQSVAYGTLLNSCSYNTVALSQKIFIFMLQLGGTYAIKGKTSLDSGLLHQFTGSHVWDTHDHIHFELNEVL